MKSLHLLFFLCLIQAQSPEAQTLFKDINKGSGSSFPNFLSTTPNGFFFQAYLDSTGTELWFSDGTPQGTHLVREFIPGPNGSYISPNVFVDGNDIWFSTFNKFSEYEIWKSDGTYNGTVKISNTTQPFETLYNQIIRHKDKIYLAMADSSHGMELWVSDGTAAGTKLIKDIDASPGFSSNPYGFTVFNDYLYFAANTSVLGEELWKTDGTEAGTVLVKDIMKGIGSGLYNAAQNICALGDSLIFSGKRDSVEAIELLYLDKNSDSIRLFKEFYSLPYTNSYPSITHRNRDMIGLVAYVGDSSITYIYDRKKFRRVIFDQFKPQVTALYTIFPFNQIKMVVAYTELTGYEYWVWDGRSDTLRLLMDIAPGPSSSFSSDHVSIIGNTMYFIGFNPLINTDIWKTKGTFETTQVALEVTDLQTLGNLFDFNGKTYLFALLDNSVGFEIYLFEPESSITQTKPASDFLLYPNPCKSGSVITVKIKDPVLSCQISDLSGKVITCTLGPDNHIVLPELSSGMYVLQIRTDQGLFSHLISVE